MTEIRRSPRDRSGPRRRSLCGQCDAVSKDLLDVGGGRRVVRKGNAHGCRGDARAPWRRESTKRLWAAFGSIGAPAIVGLVFVSVHSWSACRVWRDESGRLDVRPPSLRHRRRAWGCPGRGTVALATGCWEKGSTREVVKHCRRSGLAPCVSFVLQGRHANADKCN